MTLEQAVDSDETLWRAFLEGDDAAFTALLGRHEKALMAYLLTFFRERALAEDAFQETLLRLVRARHQFAGTHWKGWLFVSARNTAMSLLKSRRRETAATLPADLAGKPEGAWGEVREALLALPEPLRQVLTLKVDAGMTYAEIAAHLGIPAGTVGTWATQGMEQLRKRLGDS